MTLITGASLRTFGIAASTAYQARFDLAVSNYKRIAMTIPSTTSANEYSWMGKFPRIREWTGDRVVNQLMGFGYTIKNKKWESTIKVARDDIDDDNIGFYGILFSEMGQQTATFPDELVWPMLARGFNEDCFDGQFFFDTDHPVLDASGITTSVSNFQGGAGTAWYLIDDSRVMMPLVFQNRRSFEFRSMDNLDDPNVFNRDEFVYGVDGRNNVGFGMWQLAYASKQPLNAANYELALAAMESLKADYGKPLAIKPTLLVVPPTLRGAALEIVNSATGAAGATNKWKGTTELLVSPWLA